MEDNSVMVNITTRSGLIDLFMRMDNGGYDITDEELLPILCEWGKKALDEKDPHLASLIRSHAKSYNSPDSRLGRGDAFIYSQLSKYVPGLIGYSDLREKIRDVVNTGSENYDIWLECLAEYFAVAGVGKIHNFWHEISGMHVGEAREKRLRELFWEKVIENPDLEDVLSEELHRNKQLRKTLCDFAKSNGYSLPPCFSKKKKQKKATYSKPSDISNADKSSPASNALSNIGDTSISIADSTGDTAKNVVESTGDTASGSDAKLGDTAKSVAAGIGDAASSIGDAIGDMFSDNAGLMVCTIISLVAIALCFFFKYLPFVKPVITSHTDTTIIVSQMNTQYTTNLVSSKCESITPDSVMVKTVFTTSICNNSQKTLKKFSYKVTFYDSYQNKIISKRYKISEPVAPNETKVFTNELEHVSSTGATVSSIKVSAAKFGFERSLKLLWQIAIAVAVYVLLIRGIIDDILDEDINFFLLSILLVLNICLYLLFSTNYIYIFLLLLPLAIGGLYSFSDSPVSAVVLLLINIAAVVFHVLRFFM